MLTKSLAAGLLALPLLAAIQPVDTYDLTPRFEDGMQLVVTNDMEGSIELDEASAMLGEFDLLEGGVAASAEVTGTNRVVETIETTRDGAIATLRRTVEESTIESTGDFEGMGESNSMSETEEGDFVGRTLEITVDEDGEVTVVDVSEGEFEKLDDEKLETQDEKTHFEQLLPTEPVEIGGSWDPSSEFLNDAMEGLRSGAEEEGDEEEFEKLMEVLQDYGTAEATGTLVSVDEGVAAIEWSMEFTLDIQDLLAVMEDMTDPGDMEGLPPSAEASMAMTLTVEGTGSFDLRVHQLTSMELECTLSAEADGAVSEDGMDIEGNASASGALKITGGVEIVE